jgi:hypothetical protein
MLRGPRTFPLTVKKIDNTLGGCGKAETGNEGIRSKGFSKFVALLPQLLKNAPKM